MLFCHTIWPGVTAFALPRLRLVASFSRSFRDLLRGYVVRCIAVGKNVATAATVFAISIFAQVVKPVSVSNIVFCKRPDGVSVLLREIALS